MPRHTGSRALSTDVQDILLFPFNGNAKEAASCLGSAYALAGFIDDDQSKLGIEFGGTSVYSRAALLDIPEALVLAVPGGPASYRDREKIVKSLGIPNQRFASIVHPNVHIGFDVMMGMNFLAMAGVVLTSSIDIGDHVCILPNSVIHHDVSIGDWSLIGANVSIAGSVRIGKNCYIASGSQIKNDVTIGDGALIGIGSTVIRDVPAGQVFAGNPARKIR